LTALTAGLAAAVVAASGYVVAASASVASGASVLAGRAALGAVCRASEEVYGTAGAASGAGGDAAGQVGYSYDPAGRLVSVTYRLPQAGPARDQRD
jgi:hypothetical protein